MSFFFDCVAGVLRPLCVVVSCVASSFGYSRRVFYFLDACVRRVFGLIGGGDNGDCNIWRCWLGGERAEGRVGCISFQSVSLMEGL